MFPDPVLRFDRVERGHYILVLMLLGRNSLGRDLAV
jgi:hypothetical protein